MSGRWKDSGGVPKPIFFDIDPETVGHLPVLGGSAFGLSRLLYAIACVRLRPPSLDPHVFHRKLVTAAKERANGAVKKPDGRTVSISPRGVDDIGYRKTTKDLYGKVQTKSRRDESVLATARRTHSRRQQSQEAIPKRGRSPARSSKEVQYTDVGKREIEVDVPFRARPAPRGP